MRPAAVAWQQHTQDDHWRSMALKAVAALVSCGAVSSCALLEGRGDEEELTSEVLEVVNWSGTHACRPTAVHTPESVEEVEALVTRYHSAGERLRPSGPQKGASM